MDLLLEKYRELLKLEKAKIPDNFNSNCHLINKLPLKPIFLSGFTEEEETAYKENSLQRKNIKTEFMITRKEEAKDLIKEDKNITLWYIKKEDKITGPFNGHEMSIKYLDDSKIRRTGDSYFLEYEKLKNIEDLFDGTRNPQIDEVFEANKQEETLVQKVKKLNVKTKGREERLLGCKKSIGILGNRNSELNIVDLEKLIRGRSKSRALKKIENESKMKKCDVEYFLEVFLGEVGMKVLSDVDKDGFPIKKD